MKTILRDKDGKPKQFEKGFLGKINIKQENGSIKHVYNMPIELMAKGFSHVAINSIIINDSNSEYHKSQAVDIATGKKTKLYSKIEQVTENLFYFADGNYVGITNINSDVLIGDCLLITYPVNNYILIGKKAGTCLPDIDQSAVRTEEVCSVCAVLFPVSDHFAAGKCVRRDTRNGFGQIYHIDCRIDKCLASDRFQAFRQNHGVQALVSVERLRADAFCVIRQLKHRFRRRGTAQQQR